MPGRGATRPSLVLGRARQVKRGESVLLDAGSTAAALAEELRAFDRLTVSTIGLTSPEILAGAEHLDVVLLGGQLRHLSQGFVGPLTEASLERMSFDRAFMGADGVRADRGICEKDLQPTRLKELMMSRADHIYVLAHGAKLGQAPFHAWAVMPSMWTLVTNESADPGQIDAFAAAGVRTVTVPIGSPYPMRGEPGPA